MDRPYNPDEENRGKIFEIILPGGETLRAVPRVELYSVIDFMGKKMPGLALTLCPVDPESGKVRKAGFQPTGKHPRNFALTPDGNWLLCACRDDNRIEIYAVDKTSGALSPTGQTIEVGAPVCVQVLSR